MALRDEIKQQTVKLKDMSFSEKRAYIWEYYKWWIIGVIAAVFVTVSIVGTVIKNSRPTYISVCFLNCLVGLSTDTPSIEDDFIKAYGIDDEKYNLSFDYSMYIDDDYTNQNSYTSQVRLMAQYSAHTLDIVCGPESAITGPASAGGYENLEDVIPKATLDAIIAKGYEPFYFTEVLDTQAQDDITFEIMNAENEGKELSPELQEKLDSLPTTTYICGFYIDNCEYLNSQGEYGIYSADADDRPVLVVAPGCEHIDHVIEFINFVTK